VGRVNSGGAEGGAVLVVVDVGNTKAELAAVEGGRVLRRVRVATGSEAEPALRALLGEAAAGTRPEALVVASVVPLEATRWEALGAKLGLLVRTYTRGDEVPVPSAADEPARVGVDRMVNVLGALQGLAPPLVVVDVGTATTIDAVDATGRFLGGAILAGPATAMRALARGTAALPEVPLEAPARVIGRNTREAIQSGSVLGYAGSLDLLVRCMVAELGGEARVVFTGGLGASFAALCAGSPAVDDTITLRGIARLWELTR
jgi:type III pantothenate kinase